MSIEIKSLDPMRVAYMRHVGPYDDLEDFWSKFLVWAFLNDFDLDDSTVVGLNHDDPNQKQEVRFDACVAVDDSFKPTEEVGVQVVEGGKYAKITHQGPYDQIPEKLYWFYKDGLKELGQKPKDSPCMMIYRNSPMRTPPEQLLTDIFMPLE